MRFRLSYLIFLFLFSGNLFAERHLLFLGGGGEPKSSETTIFDTMIKNLGAYLDNNKWKTHVLFNGGHTKTEEILDENFKDASSVGSFGKKRFDDLIDSYEKKIKNGQLKAGEQLLIVIDSHGSAKQEGDFTHQIALGNESLTSETIEGQAELISLDRLKKLTELALQKDIQLAIIDFSCKSGATQALNNQNTCVISATGPEHLAYDTFSDYFSKNMEKGKNLENLFLEARRHDLNQSLPMISTQAGQALSNDFHALISPYFLSYNENPEIDTLSDYLLQISNEVGMCTRENEYQSLMKKLASIRSFSILQLKILLPEIGELQSLIAEYKKIQDQYISLVRSWDLPDLNKQEEFQGQSVAGDYIYEYSIKYSLSELLEIDFSQIIDGISSEINKTKDKVKKAELKSSLEVYKKAFLKQEEIIEKHPHLLSYKENLRGQLHALGQSSVLVDAISKKERALFDHLYLNLQPASSTLKNPCKKFIL